MTTDFLQKYVKAHNRRVLAETEEEQAKGPATAILWGKKPQIVRVGSFSYFVQLQGEKITVIECEDQGHTDQEDDEENIDKPIDYFPTVPVLVAVKPTQKAPPSKVEEQDEDPAPMKPNKVVRVSIPCSKEFGKAITKVANDEGWNRSQWAENILPDAYIAWQEGAKMCNDSAGSDSLMKILISKEVFDQVEDFAESECGGSLSRAIRQMFVWYLEQER